MRLVLLCSGGQGVGLGGWGGDNTSVLVFAVISRPLLLWMLLVAVGVCGVWVGLGGVGGGLGGWRG